MEISRNARAVRIIGTLDVELEDGRVGTLEVDLDTSDPLTVWGVDHEYAEANDSISRRLGRLLATTYSVKIPATAAEDRPLFTLRIPNITH